MALSWGQGMTVELIGGEGGSRRQSARRATRRNHFQSCCATPHWCTLPLDADASADAAASEAARLAEAADQQRLVEEAAAAEAARVAEAEEAAAAEVARILTEEEAKAAEDTADDFGQDWWFRCWKVLS